MPIGFISVNYISINSNVYRYLFNIIETEFQFISKYKSVRLKWPKINCHKKNQNNVILKIVWWIYFYYISLILFFVTYSSIFREVKSRILIGRLVYWPQELIGATKTIEMAKLSFGNVPHKALNGARAHKTNFNFLSFISMHTGNRSNVGSPKVGEKKKSTHNMHL